VNVKRLVAVACVSLALAGLFARFSAAAFTGSTVTPSNSVTVDALHNYFSVTPGSAVQPGTSTAVASGNVDSMSLDFGTVPSARTFTSVFTIKNVSGASRTATLSLSNVPQVASIAFASGGTSVTLAAGASTTLTVVTSSTVAGRGTGTLRLGLSGVSWLYRDYSFHVDEAPEAPTAPAVAQKPAGRLDLSWTASTTVTNLAGYDLYRSAGGGAYTKLNSSPLTGTTYSDTATTDGTSYTYKLQAVSSGSPVLTSVDSTTVTASADATAPGAPTTITLANGGGAGNAYVNAGNAGSLSVSITLPAGSLATDSVKLTVSNGGNSVTSTHAGTAGAGTLTISGLNVASLGDGTLTLSANSTDLAGNVGATTSATVTKDTVAPAAPSGNYTDINNAADQVAGTAEANASITVTKTSPTPSQVFTTSANGSGSYGVAVATTNGKNNSPISVTYTITATDAAGNTSGTTTITYSDTR
jgi:Bacterial Ig domain